MPDISKIQLQGTNGQLETYNIKDEEAREELKSSVKYNKIFDNSETIYNKFSNFETKNEYINNSIVQITKIKNIEKISFLPTNGNTSDPNTNKKNILELANSNYNFDLFINGGLQGIMIFDNVVFQSTLDSPFYIGLTNNNEMKFYDAVNNNITLSYLQQEGIVNAFSGYSPIIQNHLPYNYKIITSKASSSTIAKYFKDYIVEEKHPRQLIANDDDGNFYVIEILGRSPFNQGMNYDEMLEYFSDKNYKNVFNLDGGGSVQTVFNHQFINFPVIDNDTENGRTVPTAIGFRTEAINFE